ncbi:MAG TPA: hypothetical protein VFW38_10670 [Solirubrobacteraceae bacterium]|nr:hypothetical protein [Solirubrobacteraceae bacterium]
MSGRQVHRTGTWVLSIAMLAVGIALAVEAIAGAGGVISMRLLLALLFLAAGSGRIYVEVRRGGRA